MKQVNYRSIKKFIICCFLCYGISMHAQEKTVHEILKSTQEAMKNSSDLSCNMSYNWYDTYIATKPSIEYKGQMIKQESVVYSKINQTFFITDEKAQLALKCNEVQQALIVSKVNANQGQLPWELLETYIEQFKIKKVIDKGSHWVCTLTTDVITQLPYGKVEIYIDKKSSLMTKQVLYFLSQVPYKNAKGEKKAGNPKLEITLTDFKTVLSKDEKRTAQLGTYIKRKGKSITPVAAYKKFEIIQY